MATRAAMRHKLTDEQNAAALSSAVRTFVEAGPGTGKTTVAAARFGCIRYSQPVASSRGVVAVSFTVAATQELRSRTTGRWGRAALDAPSRVCTIDRELTDILCWLLRRELIVWPNGLTTIDPLDSCDTHPSWKYDGDPRHQTWQPDLVGGAVQPVQADMSGSRRITQKDLLTLLKQGICSHEDVRRIVRSALANPELRASVIEHRQATIAHFIVDEVFDADVLDLDLIRLHCEAGIPTTVAGDQWQALYDFRKAVPGEVAAAIDQLGFKHAPIERSHRFAEPHLERLAVELRQGGCTVPVLAEGMAVDVVLGRWWQHLWDGPDWVLPLSFGGDIDNATDAIIALLVDHVTHEKLNLRSRARDDALTRLNATTDEVVAWADGLSAVLRLLTDTSEAVAIQALAELRRCTTATPGRRAVRKLVGDKERAAVSRIQAIAARLVCPAELVKGLTAHQAKGRQWKTVGLCVLDTDVAAIESGLDINNPDHRALYVALTRASHGSGRVQT